MNTITTNELKKGTEVLVKDTGRWILADNKKGNIRMAECPNMFNSRLTLGSIYSHNIKEALLDGVWVKVQHTSAQKNCKNMTDSLFG